MPINNSTLHLLSSLSDERLWKLFQKGDDKALAEIYSRYFSNLYNYGIQLIQDTELTKDSIQDLFIELARNRQTLGKVKAVKFYLLKSLKRKLIRNKKKHQSLVFMSDPISSTGFELAETPPQKEAEGLSSENSARLKKAVNQLSKRQREVIFLYYYENLSYEEVQHVMGFESVKSVRNVVYKAIKILRTKTVALITALLVMPLLKEILTIL